MPTPQEILEQQVRVSELFHIYGELLSDRQRTFIHLYYDENLSLSEIATQHGISRQAVHDAIKHGRKALSRYEESLHLREMNYGKPSGAQDSHRQANVRAILAEMEISIHELSGNHQTRLLAQIASLRDLLEPRLAPIGTDSETREEAA